MAGMGLLVSVDWKCSQITRFADDEEPEVRLFVSFVGLFTPDRLFATVDRWNVGLAVCWIA